MIFWLIFRPSIKREKLDNAVYGNSGVVNNKVRFLKFLISKIFSGFKS